MANAKKKGLGKGLGALLGDKAATRPSAAALNGPELPAPAVESAPAPDGAQLLYLNPAEIQPNPRQPRHVFAEAALEELAASIRRDGVQEPVLVRRNATGYELVSGERRVRASILADQKEIPAICREVSDSDMLKLGLIENIQREDLNPMELASAYQNLIDEFKWTQEELAAEVGKNRATVTNTLRLLQLPELLQQQVAESLLSMGHAKALLAIPAPAAQLAAARRIIKQGLSVRQAEKLAAESAPKSKKTPPKDPNVAAIEDDLRRSLGAKVHVKSQQGGKGRIEIEYYNLDELDRLLDLLRARRG